MRDVAVVSFAQSPSVRADPVHNEVETRAFARTAFEIDVATEQPVLTFVASERGYSIR